MIEDRPGESFASLFEQGQGVQRARVPRAGDVVTGEVVQVGRDAAFVELGGRQQAFIELEDLRGPDGEAHVAVGDRLEGRVVKADENGVRLVPTVQSAVAAGAAVSLTAEEGPAAFKVAVGQIVAGAVDRVETYGVFLQIDGTRGRAGRGLVPRAELAAPRGADLRKLFPTGTKLRAKVIGIEEGKMRLSVVALKDDEERADFDGFRGGKEGGAAPTGMGTLGDLLKKSNVKVKR